MDISELKKEHLENNRLCLFTSENKNNYLYDAFSQNVYPISKETADILFSDKDCTNLPYENQAVQICEKLTKWTGKFTYAPETETHLTINFSNKCNLNCCYCYRNKLNKNEIGLEKVFEILEYADKYYKVNNNEIIFSIDMTAEAFLDADKIMALDDRFAEYEDLYIREDEIIKGTYAEFLELLKNDLYSKDEEFPQETKAALDKIILDEKLYSLMKDEKKVNDILANGHYQPPYLDKKRLLRLNRKLLEVFYSDYLKHRDYQEFRLWFMSNGTHITEKEIELIKRIRIDPFWISLDGPEEVHNANRKYYDDRGSFQDVIKNFEYLQANDINVKISCVLTNNYPYPDKLLDYFKELKPRGGLQMCPIRNGTDVSLTDEGLKEIKESYKRLFNKLFEDAKKGDFSSFGFLKEDLTMVAFVALFSRGRTTGRCTWGSEVILNAQGDMYPCLYVMGNKDYLLGNIDEKKPCTELLKPISVNQMGACSKCWARYICGGTCHYNSIISKNTVNEPDDYECQIRKFVISESISLIIRMLENSIDIRYVLKELAN